LSLVHRLTTKLYGKREENGSINFHSKNMDWGMKASTEWVT
jgi:hypothetical protein